MPDDPRAPYRLDISIRLPDAMQRALAAAVDDITAVLPNQARAIARLAAAAHRQWVAYASGAPLPDGSTIRRWSGTYARSIKLEATGPLEYTIYSDDPKAAWIEEGAQGWDMKKLLHTSHKVRESRDGKRYLIWPFRHGTPNTTVVGEYAGAEMPGEVHDWWRARPRDTWSSRVTSTFTEPSLIDGATPVTRRRYAWGDRLTANDLKDMGLDPEGAARNLVGMVRFDSDRREDGRYITFRVLHEDSDGWQIPARDGKYPAQAALDSVMKHYEQIMQAALEFDIEHLTRQAGG